MDQQVASGAPVVVALPAEIDVTNADQVNDRLDAAVRSGAHVVIADCTDTVFCDAAGVRRLIATNTRATALGVRFRLVIPPGGMLRRMLELLGVDHVLPVYFSVAEAAVLLAPPAQDPLSSHRFGGRDGAH